MKNALRMTLMLLALGWGSSAHCQWVKVGENIGSMVYLGGMNVLDKAEIILKKDQLLLLEAFDLQPQSSLEFRARSGPSTVLREEFTTDASGSLHQILFFPENNARLKCNVKYITKNGETRKLEFELKPVSK